MKTLLLLVLFMFNGYGDLIRVSNDDNAIKTSIKIDLYNNFPNKVYFILYQEFNVETRMGMVNKYFIGYQFKF